MAAVALFVLLLPAAGALALAITAPRIPRMGARLVGPGVVWLSFVLTLILLINSFSDGGKAHDFTYWTWLNSGSFHLPMNL
ncbi:MAG: hypothetical protein J2P45_32375, partial [Candidatus Dormibacteraeota bacterium]|nr:hypothetical protein [Candidatus Dormibacteraeota bacterium]